MIKDSGARRSFKTGAVRDVSKGKGRCDLLPLDIIAREFHYPVLDQINLYIWGGDVFHLWNALTRFRGNVGWNVPTMLLEAAKQYEAGANKYGDRNWQLGQPLHVFIDSAVRHYLKWKRGDNDEPHDRAFVWNVLGAIWTHENKPELIDLPFAEKEDGESVKPDRNFKVGDRVRIRKWEDMAHEFGVDGDGDIRTNGECFTARMKDICGKEFTITGFICGEDVDGHETVWNITTDMIEKIHDEQEDI